MRRSGTIASPNTSQPLDEGSAAPPRAPFAAFCYSDCLPRHVLMFDFIFINCDHTGLITCCKLSIIYLLRSNKKQSVVLSIRSDLIDVSKISATPGII